MLGAAKEAVKDCEAALALDTKHVRSHMRLAKALLDMGQVAAYRRIGFRLGFRLGVRLGVLNPKPFAIASLRLSSICDRLPPTPETRNPKPQTRNPKPETLNPKP